MMIDENLTPKGELETPKPETSGAASDAATMVEPSPDETTTTPAVEETSASLDNASEVHAGETKAEEPVNAVADEPAKTEEQAVVKTEATAEPSTSAQDEASASKAAKASDDFDLFEAAMNALESDFADGSEGGFKKLSKGDRVEATVIQVDKDRLFVNLGTKSEGIVPIAELGEGNIESAKDLYKVGDKIQVVVIRPEGSEGNAIVSKKRADFEEAWDRIEDALKSGVTLAATVVDRVKGGLSVDVGVRGFVPATHVGNGKLRNIEKYVGQSVALKVIEIDRERRKVVLSNRLAEEESRASAKDEIFKSVAPGDRLTGTVRRLTDYGAFVDLGGVDGLLHISEMSWMRINHPKEMFKEGQKIEVMVLRLDPGNGKISLGHRQVLPDPWNLIKQNYTINQKLTVTIGRLVQSGAFIKLPEGAEAFLPLSEMSYRRVKRPEEVVAEGQEIEVQIIDLRTEERRMVLSMRAAGSAPQGGTMEPGTSSESSNDDYGDKRGGIKKKGKKVGGGRRGRDDDDFEDIGRRGFGGGGSGVTIGERLGMLKGLINREEDDEEKPAAEESEATE